MQRQRRVQNAVIHPRPDIGTERAPLEKQMERVDGEGLEIGSSLWYKSLTVRVLEKASDRGNMEQS